MALLVAGIVAIVAGAIRFITLDVRSVKSVEDS
jgi:hypothetical protein